MPIGTRVSRAMGMSKIFGFIPVPGFFFGAGTGAAAFSFGAALAFAVGCPKPEPDIFSTPAPMPTSMTPALICPAMVRSALNPLEHCRFCVEHATVSGKPARNLAGATPAKPLGLQFPTTMSSTIFLSRPTFSQTAANTGLSMSSGCVSLKLPLFALAMAVRSAETMTTSSGSFTPSLPIVCPGLAVRRGCQLASNPEAPLAAVHSGSKRPPTPGAFAAATCATSTSTRRAAMEKPVRRECD
mmetsp:Transcript_127957/g.272877  ORF Transcript_127957/g.272877 Transcript_127957/m.272877 type:complete len:242 (+) Transcript_127957:814-1539(+)